MPCQLDDHLARSVALPGCVADRASTPSRPGPATRTRACTRPGSRSPPAPRQRHGVDRLALGGGGVGYGLGVLVPFGVMRPLGEPRRRRRRWPTPRRSGGPRVRRLPLSLDPPVITEPGCSRSGEASSAPVVGVRASRGRGRRGSWQGALARRRLLCALERQQHVVAPRPDPARPRVRPARQGICPAPAGRAWSRTARSDHWRCNDRRTTPAVRRATVGRPLLDHNRAPGWPSAPRGRARRDGPSRPIVVEHVDDEDQAPRGHPGTPAGRLGARS